MENYQKLTSDYLDGELDIADANELAISLQANDANLDDFVVQSYIHSQLLDWLNPSAVLNAWEAAPIKDAVISARRLSGKRIYSKPEKLDRRQDYSRLRFSSLSAIAASLLIAVSLIVLAYVIGPRPVIVAQMTESASGRWEESQAEIPAGTLLEAGRKLKLVEGEAVITFGSGAMLWLEAPASVRLDYPKQVQLLRGQVAAKVPTQARGFTVTSSIAQFIDLGTEFTLKLEDESSFELFVFEGLVEVQLDDRFGEAAKIPLRASDVRAYSFNAASGGDITRLHFPEGKEMPF